MSRQETFEDRVRRIAHEEDRVVIIERRTVAFRTAAGGAPYVVSDDSERHLRSEIRLFAPPVPPKDEIAALKPFLRHGDGCRMGHAYPDEGAVCSCGLAELVEGEP